MVHQLGSYGEPRRDRCHGCGGEVWVGVGSVCGKVGPRAGLASNNRDKLFSSGRRTDRGASRLSSGDAPEAVQNLTKEPDKFDFSNPPSDQSDPPSKVPDVDACPPGPGQPHRRPFAKPAAKQPCPKRGAEGVELEVSSKRDNEGNGQC